MNVTKEQIIEALPNLQPSDRLAHQISAEINFARENLVALIRRAQEMVDAIDGTVESALFACIAAARTVGYSGTITTSAAEAVSHISAVGALASTL